MSSKIFVDSSAFIALADQSELHHQEIVSFVSHLSLQIKRVTSNFVVDESITRIRTLLGVEAAYRFGKEVFSSGRYDIVFIDRKIALKALEKMHKFSDKLFSFTDCTSFIVMEERKIREALTLDHDFVKAGFQIHPNDTR